MQQERKGERGKPWRCKGAKLNLLVGLIVKGDIGSQTQTTRCKYHAGQKKANTKPSMDRIHSPPVPPEQTTQRQQRRRWQHASAITPTTMALCYQMTPCPQNTSMLTPITLAGSYFEGMTCSMLWDNSALEHWTTSDYDTGTDCQADGEWAGVDGGWGRYLEQIGLVLVHVSRLLSCAPCSKLRLLVHKGPAGKIRRMHTILMPRDKGLD